MANLWREFEKLLPQDRTIVVEVAGHNGDGTSTVTTQSGSTLVVDGDSVAVGDKAFVRGRAITRQAPDLPDYTEAV